MGRFRARLITYYFHLKEDVSIRSQQEAVIRAKRDRDEKAHIKSYIEQPKEIHDVAIRDERRKAIKINQTPKNSTDATDVSDDDEDLEQDGKKKKSDKPRNSDSWVMIAYTILMSETNSLA